MTQEKTNHTIVPIDDDALKPLTLHRSADIEFSWTNLSFSVVDPRDKKLSKTLLQDMNGSVKSGEVVAIMGSSGAGKSTLLNVLAGRVGPGNLSGDIHINGKPRVADSWRKLCAYVEQDDLRRSMFSNLSVTETLTYSALLRLPKKISRKEKLERVEEIIMELGLDNCRNTRIGDSLARGISGGERKRVSIGIELVTQPRVLFLDEPTSGLDAFTAFNIIETIKKLAVSHNRIVLMTIHQPRTDILDLFDKIILLSAGKLVWYGSTSGALDHFNNLGFPIPPKTNPSDFFLDIITLDQRTSDLRAASEKRIDLFQKAWLNLGMSSDTRKHDCDGLEGLSSAWPSTWLGEFYTLFNRNMKDVLRDKATLGATIGQGIFITLVMGFIFFKVTLDAAGVQNRIGVLFFICVNQTFGIVMPTLGVFPIQRQIIKRERASGTYRASSAFVAKLVSSLPLVTIGALILAIPVYWMIGLQAITAKFFIFILIVVIHAWAANALGLLIGSIVPSVQVGQIIGPLVIVIFLLFGGQLLNLEQVPDVFRWIQYTSIIAWANKALAQNEFEGLKFTCNSGPDSVSSICYNSGEQVISVFKLGSPTLWACIGINAGIAVVFLILGYAFFTRTSRPLLRLK